jgi:hypothetical protein
MQVGEPLDDIGESLLVDLRVFGADAVADGAVVDGGEVETHGKTPTMASNALFRTA